MTVKVYHNSIQYDNTFYLMLNKKVKIIATLGPALSTYDEIEKAVVLGTNVFRLNFSHVKYDLYKEMAQHIRSVQEKFGIPLVIVGDLQGPKIRLGELKEKIIIKYAEKINFFYGMNQDGASVPIPHKEVFESLTKGSLFLIDDGKISFEVLEVSESKMVAKALVDGVISSKKGLNLPHNPINLPSLMEKDIKDLEYALDLGVDYIALSFVQTKEDLLKAKEIIKGRAMLIAKIEKPVAYENIEEIAKVSDALMVARGDLGVELSVYKVPQAQKRIIAVSSKYNIPVIVATQMLESMIESSTPTRAEVSDVANAVYDGADAVMLSAESSAGKHPFESIATMEKIIKAVEMDEEYKNHIVQNYNESSKRVQEYEVSNEVIRAASFLSNKLGIKKVIVHTEHREIVNTLSKQRGNVNIIILTADQKFANQSMLNWGVYSFVDNNTEIEKIIANLEKAKHVKSGEKAIYISVSSLSKDKELSKLRVIDI